MVRKLCAGALIVLGVLPFTAPFSTLDTSDIDAHDAGGREKTVLASVSAENSDSAGSIVPPLLTRFGRLRIDVSPGYASEFVRSTSLSFVAWMKKPVGLPSRRALPAIPVQLRL